MVNDQEPRYRLVDANGDVVGSLFAESDGTLSVQEGTSGSNREMTFAPDGTFTAPTVNTESVLNSIGNAELQSSYDGLVVPVANGLGMDDAINPADTPTPIQDANDAVEAASGSRGVILLPAGVVETVGGIQLSDGVSLLGRGASNGSQILLTDETNPLFAVNGERNVLIDQIDCIGVGVGTASEPAVDFLSGTARSWNMGTVRFRDFAPGQEGVIRLNTGSVFQSHWHYIRAFQNAGTTLRDVSSGGPANSIGTLYSNAESDGQPLDFFESSNWEIGVVNVAGDVSRVSDIRNIDEGTVVRIGYYNHEPGTSSVGAAINLFNTGTTVLGTVKNFGDTLDKVVDLQTDNANNIIHNVTSNNSVGSGLLQISAQPSGESWYFGSASDIDNEAGTTTGLVRSLADAGSGNG